VDAAAPRPNGRPIRVLVVDDDAKFAAVVVRALARAGFACVTASSGGEALDWIATVHPDALVLDVMIPPPNGYEVCARLRAEGWRHAIVMVSARHNPADVEMARRAGADDFLAKPFPLAELVAAVQRLTAP
jgi:two-component system OmpR family response regulator